MSRFEGGASADYDSRIHRLVPGYGLLHQLTAAQLLSRLPDQARILVVGAGTGSEILPLAKQRPLWKFTALDISADMLEVAQQRFAVAVAEIEDRVEIHAGPVAELSQAAKYDAAICLLVTHFIPDDGSKQELLRGIGLRIKASAPLLLADLMNSADEWQHNAQWFASVQLGMAAEAADMMLSRLQQDFHLLDDDGLTTLLVDSGFLAPTTYFQSLGFKGVTALRR